MEKPSSSSTSEPAAQQISAIFPDEVIIEILTWLPVKSILRFKCVSKCWLSFISSPLFIRTHLLKSVNKSDYDQHRLLLRTREELAEDFVRFNLKNCDLSPVLCNAPIVEATNLSDSLGRGGDVERVETDFRTDNFHDVQIVGSSNGLICVTVSGDVLLWNPSIRKFKKLPDFGPKPDDDDDGYFYVFGYDEYDDDYKVFGILTDEDGARGLIGQTCLDHGSKSRSRSWSRPGKFHIGLGISVAVSLHWSTSPRFGRWGKILSLDLANETYGEVEQPKYGEGTFDWTLEVLGGCLSIVRYYRSSRVEVWILKDYGVKESWTKVVLISNFSDPGYLCSCKPVFQSNDGEILFYYLSNLPGLMLYNPKSNSLMHPHITKLEVLVGVNMYVESLVLLDDHDGGERRRL
ncbi:F-box/kelch-repeat protein At3g23880-like [Coffea arabica]|uniref:F-box/kelch-repeat protein At3g23880-like n=1 Tax=Coffea arabica TaxID=13443 RepID=A0ABM4X724_COFAR